MIKFEHYGFQEKLRIHKEIELECEKEKKDLTKVGNKTYPDYMCEYHNLKEKQISRTASQAKIDKFDVFLKALPHFAEDNEHDIIVECSEDGLNATLKITTDFIMGDTSNEVGIASAQFLNALLITYPNYIISAKDNTMTFTFFIRMYDEEDTGEHDVELENMRKIMKGILSEDGKFDDDTW